MLINLNKLKEIENELGSFYIGPAATKNTLRFRFGYWDKVNEDKLRNFLPKFMQVEEVVVDERGGHFLYGYYVKTKF